LHFFSVICGARFLPWPISCTTFILMICRASTLLDSDVLRATSIFSAVKFVRREGSTSHMYLHCSTNSPCDQHVKRTHIFRNTEFNINDYLWPVLIHQNIPIIITDIPNVKKIK
jgi:hypothetical protein